MPLKKGAEPLPDKLSDLLLAAVNDAIAMSRRKGVKLYMGRWLFRDGAGECTVCMAGACMLRRFELPPMQHGEQVPGAVASDEDAEKLRQIDRMRQGDNPCTPYNPDIQPYLRPIEQAYSRTTGRAPWTVYRKVAAALRKAGY